MRNAGGIVLGGLWILLLAVYTAPFWMRGLVSWDFAVSVDPPSHTWVFIALAAILLLMPPLLLGIATWRWIGR